jgi:hypothetical protein
VSNVEWLSYDLYMETVNKVQIDEANMDKIETILLRIEELEKTNPYQVITR